MPISSINTTCVGFAFNQFLILADQYKESVLSDQFYFLKVSVILVSFAFYVLEWSEIMGYCIFFPFPAMLI